MRFDIGCNSKPNPRRTLLGVIVQSVFMGDSMHTPAPLQKVIKITEKYFRKHGEVRPTTISFKGDGFIVGEHDFENEMDKIVLADAMVQAVCGGATAVALIAEAWASSKSDRHPSDDPDRHPCLTIAFQQADCAYSCLSTIQHQRFGRPRLSKWSISQQPPDESRQGTFCGIFERAEVRKKTKVVCDLPGPPAMLLLTDRGDCLRNRDGEALVVTSDVMVRRTIEVYTNGGEFRCVDAADHPEMLVGGFTLTSNGASFSPSPDQLDTIKLVFEMAKKISDNESLD